MADRIIMIPDTLKGVLVSRLSKGSDEHEVANVCRVSIWSSVFMCVIFLLLGQFVINILYGEEYKDAFNKDLMVGATIMHLRERPLTTKVNSGSEPLANTIWGINGAAFATGLGNFVCGLTFLIWFSSKTKIRVSEMIIPQKKDFEMLRRLLKSSKAKE